MRRLASLKPQVLHPTTSPTPNAALQEAENQPDFKLASGKFGFNIEGLMKESGVFGIDFGYNGIEVQDEPPEYKDIVPRDTNLSIKANNIPIKALTDLASTTMDWCKAV